MTHYLDDFLVLGAPDTNECEIAVQQLLDVFSRLGLPVATDKLEGPTTRLVFLGLSTEGARVVGREAGPCHTSGTTRKDLYAKAVRAQGSNGTSPRQDSPQYQLQIGHHVVGDFSGALRMMKDNSQQQAASIWTDASGSFGCGAWNPATSEWFQMQWSTGQGQVQSGIEEESITLKELLPVVLAYTIWGVLGRPGGKVLVR